MDPLLSATALGLALQIALLETTAKWPVNEPAGFEQRVLAPSSPKAPWLSRQFYRWDDGGPPYRATSLDLSGLMKSPNPNKPYQPLPEPSYYENWRAMDRRGGR